MHLEKGDKVNVVQRTGAWAQVQLKGKSGWVSNDSLSTREVKPEVSLSGPLGTDARASAGAAAKGLEPITMEYAKTHSISTKGVDEMVNIKKSVTPQMLKDFTAEGQIEPPRKRGRRGSGTATPQDSTTPAPAAQQQARPSVPDQY
jgi:hypothetical protein